MTYIDKPTFDEIVDLLEPFTDSATKAGQLILKLFIGKSSKPPNIDYSGDSLAVRIRIVESLIQYGTIDGIPPLWALLLHLLTEPIGFDKQKRIMDLEPKVNVPGLQLFGASSPKLSSNNKKITLQIEMPFDEFEKQQDTFLYMASQLVRLDVNEVAIVYLGKGSVIITLEMPEYAAKQLRDLIRKNPDLFQDFGRTIVIDYEDTMTYGDIPKLEIPAPTTNIHIAGNVSGANVNIGGTQNFHGDVTFTQTTVQRIRACPTAPIPPAHFSGRREELDHLRQTLSQGTSVAITGIQGMGGIGKTVLAQQLAQEMTDFSAVLWASLGQQPIEINILRHWARYADPDFDPGKDDAETLAYRVQALLTNLINEMCPGQVLIILDDVWEESVRAARILQKAAPANSVSLITTRSQKVVAQLRSTRLELKPMQPQEALLMMRKLLAEFPEIPDDTLIKLAKTVGFHPLAMELAAGHVKLLERPVQEIDNFIEELERGIPAGSPFRDIHLELGEEREDNLELVLSFSYNSLTETEKADYRQLGILAYGAPFDAGICQAIWSTAPKSSLDALRQRAMLNIAEEVGWYQQHSLLRAYARALLIQNNETEIAFRRYAEHITKVAEFFYENRNKREEWGILDSYPLHIHQVGDELVKQYAADNEIWGELALEFAVNIERYLVNRPEALFEVVAGKRSPVRLNWLEMGLAASHQQQYRNLEGLFVSELGYIANIFGSKHDSLKYRLQALGIYRELDDKHNEAETLNHIGMVYRSLGDNEQALRYYQQALPIRQQVGDKAGEATTFNNIGMVYSSLGDNEQALRYYQQALPIRQQVGDKAGEATTLNNIGLAYSSLGDNEQALRYYQQALPIRQQVGDKAGEATTFNNIGLAYSSLGDNEQALNFYQQALPLSQQVGDKAGEATTLSNIGLAYSDLGDKQQALSYFQQAVVIFHQIGAVAGEVSVRWNIAILKASSNINEAIDEMEQVITLLKSNNLTRSASGGTLERYEAILADLKRRRDGG